jgi:hypothetical protein
MAYPRVTLFVAALAVGVVLFPLPAGPVEVQGTSGGEVCGDGECLGAERTCTCPADCGAETCGNEDCCLSAGETAASCPGDCEPVCGDGNCRCINTLNKNFQKVSSRQAKEILACISDAAKEKLGAQSIEECLTADNTGKVGRAKRETESAPRTRIPSISSRCKNNST